MRIGVDYTAAIRQKAGIGRYTREIIKHLAQIDNANTYVLIAPEPVPKPSFPPNFEMVKLPLSDRMMTIIWQRLRIPLWVELFTGSLDIFHSPDFVLPPVKAARTILTVHDLSFLRLPWSSAPRLRAYLSKAVPRSAKRADFILADSENTRQDVIELLGVPSDKVEVLYAGVDERFKPTEDYAGISAKYRLPERFILSLGTLEPRKNYERLIEAFALLKEKMGPKDLTKLVIVGQKGWLYEGIFAAVEKWALQEEVLFPGYVADEDLPALYSAAALFVYPSLYEGFGLPPLEAMACGTPVVASNAPCLPEVLGDAALLVSPYDVEAIASAMEKALFDEELRLQLRERGLQRARLFTWEKSARKLLEIYKRVTRGG